MRAEARSAPGHYDVVHSHYWLSGQVGYLAKDRWGVPLVHSAHTLAKVKNAAMADDDEPEPRGRLIGEEQVVAEADRLIANTATEADELIRLYGADPARIDVVPPGVDTDVFTPGDMHRARAGLGIGEQDAVIVFAGRIQPLKGPEVVVKALSLLVEKYPRVPWRLVIVGGESGTGRRCRRLSWSRSTGPVTWWPYPATTSRSVSSRWRRRPPERRSSLPLSAG
jgi:D-inositol-3-phosphate glycosyltransferase